MTQNNDLTRDEQRLALWEAIQAIKIGRLDDDKLILTNLHAAGFVVARADTVAAQAQPDSRAADEIVSGLYRKFKEWSKRGFGPDDVTWCEVRAAVMDLMAVQRQKPVSGADGLPEEETCQECQGNGEIVTDWEWYKHPRPGDVGDEAVTVCPDCDGTGKVVGKAQPQPSGNTDIGHDALRCAVGNCKFNGAVAQHAPGCPNAHAATASKALDRVQASGNAGGGQDRRSTWRVAGGDPELWQLEVRRGQGPHGT
ncbi:hypothetical protein KESI111651_04175 [Kerstersia similis]